MLDPHNLVPESDETNNAYEVTLDWETGAVPALVSATLSSEPPIPDAPTKPNLMPGWRFNWDAPIILSHESESFLNAPLVVGEDIFTDVVVMNRSSVNATQPYEAHLYYDDKQVATLEADEGTPAGSIHWWADLVVLSPGVSPVLTALERARRARVPVISEIELASRWVRGRVVAVTGTALALLHI